MRSTSSPLRGEHDDGESCESPRRLAAQAQSVLSWQHQVENDQIERVPGKVTIHFSAVRGGRDQTGLIAEITGNQVPGLQVVFDDQDLWRLCEHGPRLGLIIRSFARVGALSLPSTSIRVACGRHCAFS
jgi:hypothetical protein